MMPTGDGDSQVDEAASRDASVSSDSTSIRSATPVPISDEGAGIGDATVISQRPPIEPPQPNSSFNSRELGKTLVGRSLAHFDLLEFVGGGGMGAVFRATDTMLDRTVAVKVLSRDQGRDEETVRRFRNEAQSAARLDHDNIARVYYVGEDDGWYFIVFEFIQGRNLRDLVLERGPMPVEQALRVTMQLADALEHAKSRDVVHRDIKPSNVLLMPSGRAKLVDMGLARLSPLHPSEEDLTASGVTLGTFDYISPEQARDPRMADARSDIYSLGCTLFFMLTGQPPFPDGTVLQKLLSHSTEEPPDPRQWRSDLPDALGPIISQMLAKQPGDRYQHPSDLVLDLRKLGIQVGISNASGENQVTLSPTAQLRPRFRDQLPWIVPLAVMLAVALFWQPTWLAGQPSSSSIDPVFKEPAQVRSFELDGTQRGADGTADTRSSERHASPTPQELSATGSSSDDDIVSHREGNGGPTNSEDAPGATNRVTADPADGSPVSDKQDAGDTGVRRLFVESPTPFAVDATPPLSLRAACQRAIADPQIDTIVIRRSDPIELNPLELDLDGQVLNIVAGDGFRPELVFRTPINVTDSANMGMIRVSNGQLNLAGLQLTMTVPDDTLEGEWALFQLDALQSLRLQSCSVAVHNSYGGRFSTLDNVAVFRCAHVESDSETRAPVRPLIELTDCTVKCESTVVYAPSAIPLQFRWTNGFLVTNERLARLGGRSDLPDENEQVEFELEKITGVVDQGIAELTASLSRRQLVPAVFRSKHCVWMTQRRSVLFTQSGPKTLAEFEEQLRFIGENNAYIGMEFLWRVRPDNQTMAEEIDFSQWSSHWDLEQPIHRELAWQFEIAPNRTVHETEVVDFLMDEPATVAGVRLGFDAAKLP